MHLSDNMIARALAGELPLAQKTEVLSHARECATCKLRMMGAKEQQGPPITQELGAGSYDSPYRPAFVQNEPDFAPIPDRRGAAPATSDSVRVGRYLILERLGEGGMGVVYDAYDPELDRRIAVKLLHPSTSAEGSNQGRQRILREAQAMARLAHPNIVPVYDVGTDGERVFFAMERVDGGTVRTWLQQPRSWREVVALFQQAGRGLAAAHAAGIVHRDFKPENVLMGTDGRVRVTDFGVARAVAQSARSTADPPGKSALAHRTQVVGTPGFLAPEQLDGEATTKSDQFSFCVALYEALGGLRPFTLTSFEAYAEELRSKPVDFPMKSAVPSFVQDAIRRGLEKDPAKRFSDMAALLGALSRDPRRRRVRMAALGGIVVAGIAFAAVAAVVHLQRDRACARASEQIEKTWEGVRSQVEGAFRAVGSPTAGGAFRHLDVKMSAFARTWKQARASICLFTAAVAGVQTPAAVACLDHAANVATSVTQLLIQADGQILPYASHMIAALPPVAECVDTDALANATPPPAGPKAKAVATAQARLARARILSLPRPEDGIREMQALIGELEALAYPPTLARAYFELGEAQQRYALTADATKSLEQAAKLAMGSHNDRLFVRAAGRLAILIADRHQPERAADWLALARQVFERAGRPSGLAAWLDLFETGVDNRPDRWPACVDAAERAVADAQRRGDGLDEDEARGHLLGCGGMMVGPQEKLRMAEERLSRDRDLLGPEHPRTVINMFFTASLRIRTGDQEGALDLLESAFKLFRAATLPPMAALNALNLSADVLSAAGREHEALALREQAKALLAAGDFEPYRAVRILGGLAESQRLLGRKHEALANARQVSQLCSPEVEARYMRTCGEARFVFAKVLFENARPRQATREAARAYQLMATIEMDDARALREDIEAWARSVGVELPQP